MELSSTEQATGLPEGIPLMSKRWVAILRGESALAFPQRAGRRLFGLMPSASRCKFCNAPFKGRYAGAISAVGYTPSGKNPHLCARCIERAPEGGAIVPVAVLFADVRGYTSLCEQLDPDEVRELIQGSTRPPPLRCSRRRACSVRSPATRSRASSCRGSPGRTTAGRR